MNNIGTYSYNTFDRILPYKALLITSVLACSIKPDKQNMRCWQRCDYPRYKSAITSEVLTEMKAQKSYTIAKYVFLVYIYNTKSCIVIIGTGSRTSILNQL